GRSPTYCGIAQERRYWSGPLWSRPFWFGPIGPRPRLRSSMRSSLAIELAATASPPPPPMHAPAPRREPARDPRRTTRTDSLEDAALIARLRADDETALDVLLLRFWTPLVAYAERLVGTRDAAEDIVQRTFCRV